MFSIHKHFTIMSSYSSQFHVELFLKHIFYIKTIGLNLPKKILINVNVRSETNDRLFHCFINNLQYNKYKYHDYVYYLTGVAEGVSFIWS